MIGKSLVTAGAGLTAAFVSALCCAGPLLAVAAGISGKVCAEPRIRRRRKYLLWVATTVAIVFATYPRWSGLIL